MNCLAGKKISLGRMIHCIKKSWDRVRKFEDLPVNAQNYVKYIEEALGVPINYIGVGPAREGIILK